MYALVRGTNERDVTARLEHTLRSLSGADHPYARRVVAVRGDITRPDLGLGSRRDQLAEQVSEVVHGAASVSFQLGLEDLRQVNVEGTRRVLEFAERADARGGLRRFSYISTAYVAGERDSGWTQSFNVLYWPLRAYARGVYTALPARRDAPVDVLPVDYVADAVFALSQLREAEGATFHLTADAHTSSVGELVELASTFFERPAPGLTSGTPRPSLAPSDC